MKIQYRNVIQILPIFICVILTCVVSLNADNSYKYLGVYSLIVLFFSLHILRKIKKYDWFSFPIIFMVLVWIFHFSFFALYFFGKESVIAINDLLRYDSTVVIKSFYIGIFFYLCLLAGLCISNFGVKSKIYLVECKLTNEFVNNIRVIFVITLIPYLIYSVQSLFMRGYGTVRASIMTGALSYVSLICYSTAIIIFFWDVKNNKTIRCLFLMAVFAIQIFSGQRFDSVCIEIVFFMILLSHKKVGPKRLVILVILGLISIYFLNIIGTYRFDFNLMKEKMFAKESFQTFLETNPVFMLFSDFGGTVASLLSAVKNFNLSNYFFGITYIVAAFYIFPMASRFFPEKYLNFVNAFPLIEKRSLGGSVIGEAYVNFGIFGGIVLFLLGIFISRLYSRQKKTTNEFYYCWSFICFLQVLNIVRGYIKNVVFLSFWMFVVVIILSKSWKSTSSNK